jgi:hypothetical protein
MGEKLQKVEVSTGTRGIWVSPIVREISVNNDTQTGPLDYDEELFTRNGTPRSHS